MEITTTVPSKFGLRGDHYDLYVDIKDLEKSFEPTAHTLQPIVDKLPEYTTSLLVFNSGLMDEKYSMRPGGYCTSRFVLDHLLYFMQREVWPWVVVSRSHLWLDTDVGAHWGVKHLVMRADARGATIRPLNLIEFLRG